GRHGLRRSTVGADASFFRLSVSGPFSSRPRCDGLSGRIQKPHARHDHGACRPLKGTRMRQISRRKLITTGLTAAAGVSGLAAAVRMANRYGLSPPDCGGVFGAGETLTYASHRLLTRHSMAREFPRSQISKSPFVNGRRPQDLTFKLLEAGNFADW